MYQVEHDKYPDNFDSNNCPTGPNDSSYCLKSSGSNEYYYTVDNTTNPASFSLIVQNGDTEYCITQNNGPTAGECPLTVTIGTQVWMKYNLNIGYMITTGVHPSNNGRIEKHCYGDNPNNCAIYGGLYDWNEMMRYSTSSGAQGICPSGFHVPTEVEWYTLEHYVDPTINNPSDSGWRGTDGGTKLKVSGSTGFNALLAGTYGENGFGIGSYNLVGSLGVFWNSDIYDTSYGWVRDLSNSEAKIGRMITYTDDITFNRYVSNSVRCIHN